MDTIKVWTEQHGWVIVGVEKDRDQAINEAMKLRGKLGSDRPIMVENDSNGKKVWHSNG